MNIKSLLSSQFQRTNYPSLFACRDDQTIVNRLSLSDKLDVHTGCVNTICWSDENVNLILSGSDDQKLAITDAFSGRKKGSIATGHRSNIFSARFLPCCGDQKVVSCAAAGDLYLTDLTQSSQQQQQRFACHGDKACYEVRTVRQDPFSFSSCGQDGTCKWFDVRCDSRCDTAYCRAHTLVRLATGISAMAINPLVPYHLACAGLDGYVRFYDRRCLSVGGQDGAARSATASSPTHVAHQSTQGMFACFSVPGAAHNEDSEQQQQQQQRQRSTTTTSTSAASSSKRVTSLQYDRCGREVLVSYQSDNIYLLDWRDLSEENKNAAADYVIRRNEQPLEIIAGSSSSSSNERKFRIQTDWSDTGPDSLPFNEIDANDPRTYLTRRLNDWFTNICTASNGGSNGSNNNSATSTSTGNRLPNGARGRNPTTTASTSTWTTDRLSKSTPFRAASRTNDANNEDRTSSSDDDQDEEDNEDNNTDNDNDERRRHSSSKKKIKANLYKTSNDTATVAAAAAVANDETTESKRTHLISLTSSLIGSRIRYKQTIRLENNILRSKPSPRIKMMYTGHRNTRTMIKECNFWGNDHVLSGSDCGHVFVWNKHTGKIVNLIEADKHVVNCVQENPLYPVLACSGIDYNVKIFRPTLEVTPTDLNARINQIVKRNKLMLDDTKKTIFIPVQFMIPALRLFGNDIVSRNSSSNRTRENTRVQQQGGSSNNSNNADDRSNNQQ